MPRRAPSATQIFAAAAFSLPLFVALSHAAEPPRTIARSNGATAPAVAAPAVTAAAQPAATSPVAANPEERAELARKLGARVEDLRATQMPGVYELRQGADLRYVSADGTFMLRGDLYRLTAKGEYENLTEDRQREIRRSLVNEIPESQMLVFGPKNPKYTLTVFTDVDCSWCRKLHSQIADYNKAGIKVRYVFFPRSGPDTDSWHKAEEVWCSKDRNDAFNHAMRGEQKTVKACPTAPIRRMYELGRTIGVDATPGLLLSNGELHLTYASPADLTKYLQAAR